MERRAMNPLLVVLVLLVLSCLLVYPPSPPPPHHPYSSVSMPRSLRPGSQQQHLTDLKLASSQKQETTIGVAINLGWPKARMDLDTNDYSPPDHDHDHDPGHPPPPPDHDHDPGHRRV